MIFTQIIVKYQFQVKLEFFFRRNITIHHRCRHARSMLGFLEFPDFNLFLEILKLRANFMPSWQI